MVLCDDRESKAVQKACRKYFPDLVVSRLEVGDLVSDDLGFCIERKSILDLGSSISDKRIFRQARDMRESYPHSYIIQVGTYESIRKSYYHDISVNRFIGAVSDLTMLYQVPVLQCENLSQYARYCDSLYRKINGEVPNIIEKNKKHSKKVSELNILLGIPGLGEKKSHAILRQFPTVRSICDASTEDLASVKGIGKKFSRKIKKVFY